MTNNTSRGANMTISILRLPQVKARTGVSRSGLYAGIKEGNFPAPVAIGPRAVGWLESDITEWIESRPRAGSVADSFKRKSTVAAQAAMRKNTPAAVPSVKHDGQPVGELRRVLSRTSTAR